MKMNFWIRCLAVFLVLTLLFSEIATNLSAQSLQRQKRSSGNDPTVAKEFSDDAGLAVLIRKLTDRSGDGIVVQQSSDGSFFADLMGKFQNVVLGKLSSNGEPVAACIASLGEANRFLGRDLETGLPIREQGPLPESIEIIAARHGMSVAEFKLYNQMITEFQRREALLSPASASITIQNNDGILEGFNDALPAFVIGEGGNFGLTRGAQRLNVFNQAASIWGSFLDSAVPITVQAQFDPMTPCSPSGGVLGSSGAITVHRDFANAGVSNTWYPQSLANKQAGSDLSTSPDINSTFNTDIDNGCLGAGTRFYYGYDNAFPPGTINLLIVVLHEFGHGLGFQTFVDGSTGAYFSSFPDIFLRRMYDRSVGLYWHQMSNAQRAASAVNPNNVLFDSPSVRLESGFLTAGREASTGRVELYTPNPLQSGSSLSHFNTAATPNLLMEPAINPGLPLSLDLTRQVMRDLGWYRDTTADTVPDTIINVTPNNGTVIVGQQVPINWTNTGGFNRNVTIDLSTDGGSSWSPIASNIANTGSYNWTVPNSPTSQARIRVRETGFAEPAGFSAGNFSILASPSAALVAVSGRVFDSIGRAVPGAIVAISDANGTTRTTRSNSFGYFAIEGLTSGRQYFVNASARGLSFQPISIDLTQDVRDLSITALD
jgi:hypothetical protein